MSATVVLFVQDLEKMHQAYLARIEPNHINKARGRSSACAELLSELEAAGENLQRARVLATYCNDCLHVHHQTLGIVQEAEADFNSLRDDEDIFEKVRHFFCLTERFLAVLS